MINNSESKLRRFFSLSTVTLVWEKNINVTATLLMSFDLIKVDKELMKSIETVSAVRHGYYFDNY